MAYMAYLLYPVQGDIQEWSKSSHLESAGPRGEGTEFRFSGPAYQQ